MVRPERLLPLLLLFAPACTSCGDDFTRLDVDAGDGSRGPDAATDPGPDADPLRPARLEETGLYADIETQTISALVTEYTPQFALWSDGAVKRRWFQLPPNAVIDTSDMDFWIFPEGTRLWKQFAVDDKIIETRLYWKQGPLAGDWRAFTYAWNSEQTEALSVINGIENALGTDHDIPSVFICNACHGPQPDIVLGISAIQSDSSGPGFGIDDLIAANLLSAPPAGAEPHFPLPGDAVDQPALGYLHANCGGCHFNGSTLQALVPIELRLDVASMATVEDTAAYRTTVGVNNVLPIPNATANIEPGDPSSSAVHIRMSALDNTRMPEVGSEVVDTVGLAIIDAWINAVPPPP